MLRFMFLFQSGKVPRCHGRRRSPADNYSIVIIIVVIIIIIIIVVIIIIIIIVIIIGLVIVTIILLCISSVSSSSSHEFNMAKLRVKAHWHGTGGFVLPSSGQADFPGMSFAFVSVDTANKADTKWKYRNHGAHKWVWHGDTVMVFSASHLRAHGFFCCVNCICLYWHIWWQRYQMKTHKLVNDVPQGTQMGWTCWHGNGGFCLPPQATSIRWAISLS